VDACPQGPQKEIAQVKTNRSPMWHPQLVDAFIVPKFLLQIYCLV
jgi:hypothetical protein